MGLGTTNPGYENKNAQRVITKTDRPSNHHNQAIYEMECQMCNNRYGANGSDIWLRKCPACQGGAESSEA